MRPSLRSFALMATILLPLSPLGGPTARAGGEEAGLSDARVDAFVLPPLMGDFRPHLPEGGLFPALLSEIPELYLMGAGRGHEVPGVIPFRPISELWSDGSLKERYMAPPAAGTVGFQTAGSWNFADGTILVKNFILPRDFREPEATGQRIETRFLYKIDGQWVGNSYEWDAEEQDAVLLDDRKTRSFSLVGSNGVPFTYGWLYPSPTDCMTCHTPAANFTIGPSTPQLNSRNDYGGGVAVNQIEALESIGTFSAPLPAPVRNLPAMVDPLVPGPPLHLRVRAYFDSNCAMCHRPGGSVPSVAMDMRWETLTAQKSIINADPVFGRIGMPLGKLVLPGEPNQSILLERMLRNGPPRMPPLATSRIDAEGTALVREWILSLNDGTAGSWLVH